jgi:hypothetical protein
MSNFCTAHTDMPKKRGRGRPKRSRDQNCQESVRRNVSSPINLSNMVENVHGCEESENAGMVACNIWILISFVFMFTLFPLFSIQQYFFFNLQIYLLVLLSGESYLTIKHNFLRQV